MAASGMKFITIVGHAGLRGEILAALHKLGVVQLTDVDEAVDESGEQGAAAGFRSRLRQESRERVAATDRRLADVATCLNYIQRFTPIQKGLVESFLAARENVDQATWQGAAEFDYSPILAACQQGEARLAEIRGREAEITARIKDLEPLVGLQLDLGDLEGTREVSIFFGDTQPQRFEALEAGLGSLRQATHLEKLGSVGRHVYFLLFYLRGTVEVPDLLRANGIEAANAPAAEATAEEVIAAGQTELAKLAGERESIAAAARELASERLRLSATYDRLLLQKQREEAEGLLAGTAKTFVVQGWCPANRVSAVERTLEAHSSSTALEVRDPRPSEQPPIRLENRPITHPFEIVTNIYGFPSYREVDPTPVLSPFFLVFFGIALGDAGYGLVVIAYCRSMMRKRTTPISAHKMFRLLTYCGWSTVVFGALTGSWFGNLLDYLPPALGFITAAKNAIVLFDPIKSPMVLMGISLVLGVLHIMTGVAVKGYMAIKAGRVKDAIMDQGLWLVLLPSIGLMATGSVFGETFATIAKYAAIAAAVGLVLTQGRGAKNVVAKLFSGLYSLYGLIGYISDTLSYTRLMALGLATGALGMAINQIAMMLRPIPVVGIFLMLLVMVAVHLVSLLINVFGSFIHSGRLQFVEFFTKFFEGGGKPFRPFAERPRYTEVGPD